MQAADNMAEAMIDLVNLSKLAWKATNGDTEQQTTKQRMERARSLRQPDGWAPETLNPMHCMLRRLGAIGVKSGCLRMNGQLVRCKQLSSIFGQNILQVIIKTPWFKSQDRGWIGGNLIVVN